MAGDCEFTPVVHRLGCLRGIRTLTGFALAVEIGDWDRFTGKTIGSFAGLVPSKYSSASPLGHDARPAQAARGRQLAIARELAGWCWSLAVLEEQPDHNNLLRRQGSGSEEGPAIAL